MNKPPPIGVSDFNSMTYRLKAGKSLNEDLAEKRVEVALISRPRCFGKTLNLSMLRYFFEKSKEDTSCLFRGLNIWYHASGNARKVSFIFILLKDEKHSSWEKALASLQRVIAEEFQPDHYLLEEEFLNDEEKENYYQIIRQEEDEILFGKSLHFLSKWLPRYHKERVILSMNRDTPAHAAFVGKYYDTLIEFLRTSYRQV